MPELSARPLRAVFLALQQARVAADLAQLEQRLEDHDAAARQAAPGDLLADLAVQRQAHGLVEFALRLAEFDELGELALRRQFRGHLFLGPSQQERPQARGQVTEACLVAVLLDRRAVVLGELAGVAEPAGHQEMEQRPEFAEVVLQRRAGQAQAMPCRQLAGGDGGLGGGVLDVLRLVEDQQVEPPLAQLGGVAWQQGIGGQHQVVLVDAGEVAAPTGAVQGQHAQIGSEALGLVQPVGDQAGGHHHQRRRVKPPGLLFQEHVGQRLQGLAQPHVVGQHAAAVEFAQGLHPAQAFELVGPQFGAQALRRGRRTSLETA